MSIYTIKIIGEASDVKPVINKHNIVVKNKYNRINMMVNSAFTEWSMIFIFPDNEKAEYFAKHFKIDMKEYQEGMLKDDYVFHIIHCEYPEPEEIYADQLRMKKDYVLSEFYHNAIA